MSPTPDRGALESRLRRRKRRLERINPLEQPERYREAFIEVIDLEAALHRRGRGLPSVHGDHRGAMGA